MKLAVISFFIIALTLPQISHAQQRKYTHRTSISSTSQRNIMAERMWKSFFPAFRAAVRTRDRKALRRMMTPDFFTSGGVGDDNRDGDDRDETFEFWDGPNVNGWQAFSRVLAKGTVANTAWRERGSKTISRVAPPIANNRRAINKASFDWFAVFEFRKDGRWYCTTFAQCCD